MLGGRLTISARAGIASEYQHNLKLPEKVERLIAPQAI